MTMTADQRADDHARKAAATAADAATLAGMALDYLLTSKPGPIDTAGTIRVLEGLTDQLAACAADVRVAQAMTGEAVIRRHEIGD